MDTATRIAFKDFSPIMLSGGFFSREYETVEAVVARANDWMNEVGAQIVNIETLLLPNLDDTQETSCARIRTSGDVSSYWYQVVRVWYTQRGATPD